ncbi:MFS transporter [Sphingobacterium athyrii]|uniref:MFS transporter n=2 Tax=Sphingobacteriaceae TaxID=84566 RepID=UPI0011B290A8|nr:MFS transporter [Sphingobacterium athyrii]
MSTLGHSGQLLGPALLGGVAQFYGISTSLMVVAFLMLLLSVSYWIYWKFQTGK